MDPRALLQAYRARLPKRDSDAEFLGDNVYASETDPTMESEPRGLVDRLYRERFEARPDKWNGTNTMPTTKNRYA